MIRALILLFAALVLPAPATAEPADIDAAARGVVRVVVISREDGRIIPLSHGTGFAVGPETIVTNYHVVADARGDPTLTLGIVPSDGGEAVFGRLIAASERNDLALIRTTATMRLAPLTIASSAATDAGVVTSVGYPQNVDRAQGLRQEDIFRAQPPVKATGFLSGRRPSREFDTLLHTAPIARGSSGGPLLDECGRVVGVNSFGAISVGADAEFFFAISTRELLPFLRANDITAQVSTLACRSLAEIEQDERAREERARARAQARALAAERSSTLTREEARREITFAVMAERENLMALAFLLALTSLATGSIAWRLRERRHGLVEPAIEPAEETDEEHAPSQFHLPADMVTGVMACAALAGAAGAWLARPDYADIEPRLEAALTSDKSAKREPAQKAPQGSFTCTLEQGRSRATGAPVSELSLDWSAGGCVNDRTQYALLGGEWTRIFVPASEAAVSVNRFDPATREFVIERHLLGRQAMTSAREVRASFQAPGCGMTGDEPDQAFLSGQSDLLARLPDRPNERLIYVCAPSGR